MISSRNTRTSAGAYVTLADAQYGMGRYEEALCSFGVFLESAPENVSAWCVKGMALRALGREDEALACFGAALYVNPLSAEALAAMAELQSTSADARLRITIEVPRSATGLAGSAALLH